MKVKIIVVKTGEKADALIREGKRSEIPSFHDEWYFDLAKQMRKLPNATAYVLVKAESEEVVEGCMIFQLVDKKIPVMAYLEVAPHNKKAVKEHEDVAGCLIAYACKLSLIRGVGVYQGILSFRVGEEKKEDEEKLINLYKKKYYAVQIGNSAYLEISDEGMDAVIKRYLG